MLNAEGSSDDERIERLLCGAVRLLRANRAKPESSLYLSLMLLAKTRPLRFITDHITEASVTLQSCFKATIFIFLVMHLVLLFRNRPLAAY